MDSQPIVVWGAGGHALVVADALALCGSTVSAFLVDTSVPLPQSRVALHPIVTGISAIEIYLTTMPTGTRAIVAIGMLGRVRTDRRAYLAGFGIASTLLFHPTATISRSAQFGSGVQVLAGAHVGPSCFLGNDVIVNTGAIVEHDVHIGQGCDIAPGAIILGAAEIGDNCVIGAGATILPKLSIAPDTTIGAGAVVVRSITRPGVYIGIPARRHVSPRAPNRPSLYIHDCCADKG